MISTKDLVLMALFAALIAVLGLIPKLDLPFAAGVPITAQTLGVMLAGLILGSKRGALAVLLFLFVVALGAPVLSGGRGGLGVFVGPTVGFLVGWIFGAFACGWLADRFHFMQRKNRFWSAFVAALLGGVAVVYVFGIPGLALIAGMNLKQAFIVTLAFLPGDLLKALVSAWVAKRIGRV